MIEDAAEGLGATVKGKKVGSVSESAIFSFCGNKVLTTGEGGAVVTNSKEIYEKIKLIRSHGRIENSNYFNNPNVSNYVQLGYNWRMSTITAALGISQIQKLDKIIKMRQENAHYISSRINKINEITVPNPPENYDHIYQMYSIKLKEKSIRDNLQEFLTEKRKDMTVVRLKKWTFMISWMLVKRIQQCTLPLLSESLLPLAIRSL